MAARRSTKKSTTKSEPKGQIKISQANPFWTHLPEGAKSLVLSKEAAIKLFQQFINLPVKDFEITETEGVQALEFKFN